MPSTATETVAWDVKAAITEMRKGRVQFGVDKQGIVHVPIGEGAIRGPAASRQPGNDG